MKNRLQRVRLKAILKKFIGSLVATTND